MNVSALLRRAAVLVCLLLPCAVSADKAGDVPRVLIMGDSLSAAYKLSAEDGWAQLLVQRLREQGYPHEVVNASISGATTSAGLQRLPSLLESEQPNIVLLELGANDGLQGKPIPLIRRNLQKLITLSEEAGAQVLLLAVRLPPNYGSRYTRPFHQNYVTLAEENDLPLVPFLLEGVAGNETLMQSDGLHPKAEGQPIVLENIWLHLKPLL